MLIYYNIIEGSLEVQEKRRRRRRRRRRRSRWRKGRKVAKDRVFPMICVSGGRKVGSLKRRVRSHLARWEMKNCTPLWRGAHFEVKSVKNWRSQTTFGSWDDEKVHSFGAKHISKSKCTKHTILGKSTTCSDHTWTFRCRFAWPHKGFCTLSKTWGCSSFKSVGRQGTFEEDLQRCISRGRRSTRDMFIRDVRRPGCWFPEKGCILEHQIFSFATMILRDGCSTSYDLASLFRGRRSTLETWTGKIAKRMARGRQLCTQLSMFEGSLAELLCFWCCQAQKLRKSRRIASFLTLSSSKAEEVSQNCFVFKLAERQTDRLTDR